MRRRKDAPLLARRSPAPPERGLAPSSGFAVVRRPFSGVAGRAVYPKKFHPGEIVAGELAEVAVREGWAEPAGNDGLK